MNSAPATASRRPRAALTSIALTRLALIPLTLTRLALILACLANLFAATTIARAADLPKEVLTADDIAQYVGTIKAEVKKQVDNLASGDSTKIRSARESLIEEVRGIVPPGGAFLDDYCGELSGQLTPLAANPDPRVRLNVAIVTAKVAERAQDASGRLAPLIVVELKDTNMGVVLWAMRAARFTIVPILNVKGANNQLVPQILAAAKAATNGAVVGAAYDALTADSTADNIAATEQLLAFRISQYAVAVPIEPPMDGRATGFLTQLQIWSSQTKPKQFAIVQMVLDLIGGGANAYPTAQGNDRDQLTGLLSSAGEALVVVGINKQDPVLQAGVTPLAKVSTRMSPAAITQSVNAAFVAVLTSFPGLHKPVSTQPSSTAPAAAPVAAK